MTIAALEKSALENVNVSLRDNWLHSLKHLVEQVSEWARTEPGWQVDPLGIRSIFEEPFGTYSVSVVTIQTPKGRLVLEPIARTFPGRGIVEFYAWPTLFRVRLSLEANDSAWQVRVDSGFILHEEWNRSNFIRLGNDLLGAS